MDSGALFHGLRPPVMATTLRQGSRRTRARLVMTGRVTLFGLSRWAGTGGSERTGPRFCSTVIPWATRCGVCCRQHVSRPEDVSLLAGDAMVVTSAGKPTHGLDRFFARLSGQPVPGLASHRHADGRQRDPDSSSLDVKADDRGSKYVEETRPMLPEKPAPVL